MSLGFGIRERGTWKIKESCGPSLSLGTSCAKMLIRLSMLLRSTGVRGLWWHDLRVVEVVFLSVLVVEEVPLFSSSWRWEGKGRDIALRGVALGT